MINNILQMKNYHNLNWIDFKRIDIKGHKCEQENKKNVFFFEGHLQVRQVKLFPIATSSDSCVKNLLIFKCWWWLSRLWADPIKWIMIAADI